MFFRFVWFNNIDEILIIEFGKLFFVVILLMLIIGNSCIMGYRGKGGEGGGVYRWINVVLFWFFVVYYVVFF